MYIDAPVSGGPKGADDGTLTVMMGGPEPICEYLRPVLHSYASKILHFGPVGSGMAAKLVNQALVAMHAQAACEALYLADKVPMHNTLIHSIHTLNTSNADTPSRHERTISIIPDNNQSGGSVEFGSGRRETDVHAQTLMGQLQGPRTHSDGLHQCPHGC